MAEAMTSATAELLISKIVSSIEHEASLLGGLSAEFDDIKNELISMRSFLEDADKRAALTHGESTWVDSIRDLAYEVEDAMDDFMYHRNKQRNGGKFTRFIHQTIFLPKNIWIKRQIAMKIQNIKRKIKAIDERRRRYGIERIEGTSYSDDKNSVKTYAESSLFIEEENLVGIQDNKEQLVKWLTEEESERTVISVVGMGGLGKTTLVARAYNSSIVKRHFDCYAWITVSQKYVVDELLKRMIEEFYSSTKEVIPTNLNTMRYRELVDTLVNYLGTKRYMLVLDDIWSSMLWQDINVSLPDKGFGSRVMLTTRGENIASSSFGVRNHVHHLKSLGEDEAWELFSMKAFTNNLDRRPPELEIIARNLIKKCEGLPLAIVALGGAMSSKKLESEWKRVNDNLDFELRNNPELQNMKLILFLSFIELPYQLKLCFLYCCLFPEDFEIRRKKLIRLWMAEGFVEKAKGIKPEDVAESFLMELIQRNMLQVVRRNEIGRAKVCKMHDLLREIALSLSETQKFGAIMHDVPEAFEECRARRLSIQIMQAQIKSLEGMSQLRSLLVFGPSRSLYLFPSGLRWLRVLDMHNVPIKKLPDELVDMFNLRYLSLVNTYVEELPKSIGRLRNLETLILRHSKIKVIPTGITKLQNLRHLITYDDEIAIGTTVPSNIWKLENLQVLDRVKAEPNLIRCLRNMTQLTKLGMTEVREAYEQDLCTTIENMNLLRHLYLAAPYGEKFLRMDKLSSAPPCLKTMVLVGRLVMVPRWFNSLPRLTKLRLHSSQLTEDLLPFIQALPCLTVLELLNAYSGTKLHFSEGFHKLKTLHLLDLPQMNEMIIDKGVMPGLRLMELFWCSQLKKLPQGIEHLANLEHLHLTQLPREIYDRLNEAESVERLKVRHIPKVALSYRSTKGNINIKSCRESI